jgi:hypothetical protein
MTNPFARSWVKLAKAPTSSCSLKRETYSILVGSGAQIWWPMGASAASDVKGCTTRFAFLADIRQTPYRATFLSEFG